MNCLTEAMWKLLQWWISQLRWWTMVEVYSELLQTWGTPMDVGWLAFWGDSAKENIMWSSPRFPFCCYVRLAFHLEYFPHRIPPKNIFRGYVLSTFCLRPCQEKKYWKPKSKKNQIPPPQGEGGPGQDGMSRPRANFTGAKMACSVREKPTCPMT